MSDDYAAYSGGQPYSPVRRFGDADWREVFGLIHRFRMKSSEPNSYDWRRLEGLLIKARDAADDAF